MRKVFFVLGIIAAFVVVIVMCRRPNEARDDTPSVAVASEAASAPTSQASATQITNAMGDLLADHQAPVFLAKVFPTFRDFTMKLKQLGISPFDGDPTPESCGKIRVIKTANGIICTFNIGVRWTADYVKNGSYEGIAHFGQRGPDNPFRAISRADTEALRKLSDAAVNMPETEVWKMTERIESAFGIDRSRFEPPIIHEESMFEHRLGMHTVRYRHKGADPLNQMNYTRSFTLKATSPTKAALVRYSNMEAR